MIPDKYSHSTGNAKRDREIQYKSVVKARAETLQSNQHFFLFFPLALTSLSCVPAASAFHLLTELPSEHTLLVGTELLHISGTRRCEDHWFSAV